MALTVQDENWPTSLFNKLKTVKCFLLPVVQNEHNYITPQYGAKNKNGKFYFAWVGLLGVTYCTTYNMQSSLQRRMTQKHECSP